VIETSWFIINDIDLIELNEAFASQIAVTRELNLNPDIINVNGGAIALDIH
jgi:acetyl-CoA acyltransferase